MVWWFDGLMGPPSLRYVLYRFIIMHNHNQDSGFGIICRRLQFVCALAFLPWSIFYGKLLVIARLYTPIKVPYLYLPPPPLSFSRHILLKHEYSAHAASSFFLSTSLEHDRNPRSRNTDQSFWAVCGVPHLYQHLSLHFALPFTPRFAIMRNGFSCSAPFALELSSRLLQLGERCTCCLSARCCWWHPSPTAIAERLCWIILLTCIRWCVVGTTKTYGEE